MKKVISIIIGLIIIVCIILLLVSINSKPVKNSNSQAQPDIAVKGTIFDMTPESCIGALNEDLKDSGLPPIPSDYQTSTQDLQVQNGNGEELNEKGVTYYDFNISDTLTLRLISFQSLDNGIPVIELIETGKKVASEDSKLHAYFQIAAANICPQFDADQFKISAVQNKSFELNGILFWGGSFNKSETEKKDIYIMTTDSDLFDFYL